MRTLLRKGITLIFVLALAISAGCTSAHGRGDALPGEEGKGVELISIAPDPVVIQGILNDQILVATVHPIEVMDGYAVLTVDYSIPEDSASSTRLFLDSYMGAGVTDFGCSDVRVVDAKKGKVWAPGYYPGHTLFSVYAVKPNKGDRIELTPGQTKTSTTLFPFVDTDAVDVLLPWLGFAYDVPVVKGNAETPTIESFKEYSGNSDIAFQEPQTLSPFVQSYDNAQSTTKEGNQQRVILASDVLFAFDVYTLSDAAAARVDQVAEEIAQAASGGEIKVTGHTDDVGTDAYNLDLSNKRAASVAERLKAKLGTSFSVISEGKGKSSPAVEGTDEEARKANRRVEIAFTADQGIDISKDTKTGDTQIPTATTPVATGHNPVEFGDDEKKYYSNKVVKLKVSVPSVQRRGDWLVGSVTVTNVGDSINCLVLRDMLRSESDLTKQRYRPGFVPCTQSVTLLTSGGRVFPAQYSGNDKDVVEKTSSYVDVLADRHIWVTDFKPGDSLTYTVVWPDTGQDTVTIDVPDRFRITDILVEGR